jgi:polyisoprenyl-teichoic acid--peptidoglycan teichoic acid transferase
VSALKSNNSILPVWLSLLLSVTFVGSGTAVLAFAYLTAQIVWNRPLNPVELAAAQVADISLDLDQIAPPEVILMDEVAGQPTPTLIPTSEFKTDRINILLMGIDRRPGEAFISRTDSMMILSVDTRNETISILSVPRDLYVIIPGRGRDRINTAFVYGSTGNNPAGGAALAMSTVEYNLGVHIDHYMLIDFAAFINGINALGGIDIYVPVTINDTMFPDMNYGYDPFYIAAGQQHIDGETALKYARTRYQDSDFVRAGRQQQILLAARQKALSLGVPEMIRRAPTLYRQVEQGVRTDLSLEELVTLARIAADIPRESIQNEVLDQRYVSGHRTEQGASVQVMNNEATAELIRRLFYE